MGCRPAGTLDGMDTPADPELNDELTALRSVVREPMDHVECFPAPPSCKRVMFTTDEVTSMCPVTGQPDWSTVAITYEPDQRCVESKSLKLFLWSFRDQQIFAEALAAAIAAEIDRAAAPHRTTVVVTQHVRGGIVTEATAELP